jgi:ABC-type multidrug transport system fused ATPase/permease subunit
LADQVDGRDITTLILNRRTGLALHEQLLASARAFLARPSVLILDEATSSVNCRSEVLVQRA